MNLPLILGSGIILTGTTLMERPELAGVVLEDVLRPFSAGLYSFPGSLQERVVRCNSTGLLAFYYAISEVSGANIFSISLLYAFARFPSMADVDFRTDGLGVVGPSAAGFNSGGELIFEFGVPVAPGMPSRFMFVIFPGVTDYQTGGTITINDDALNSFVIRDCFRPVVSSGQSPHPPKDKKEKKGKKKVLKEM